MAAGRKRSKTAAVHGADAPDTSTARSALGINDTFLRLPDVMRITGLGRTMIYGNDDFPRPYKLAQRASAWRESEVRAWMDSRPRTAADA